MHSRKYETNKSQKIKKYAVQRFKISLNHTKTRNSRHAKKHPRLTTPFDFYLGDESIASVKTKPITSTDRATINLPLLNRRHLSLHYSQSTTKIQAIDNTDEFCVRVKNHTSHHCNIHRETVLHKNSKRYKYSSMHVFNEPTCNVSTSSRSFSVESTSCQLHEDASYCIRSKHNQTVVGTSRQFDDD